MKKIKKKMGQGQKQKIKMGRVWVFEEILVWLQISRGQK